MRWSFKVFIGVALAISSVSGPYRAEGQSPAAEDRIRELRRLGRNAKLGLSGADASAVSRALARSNVATKMLLPVPPTPTQVGSLADVLAAKQLAWQNDRSARAVPTARLAAQLNRRLELNAAASYLKIRDDEVDRVRVSLWFQLPELSTGPDRSDTLDGGPIFRTGMSPFEAYLVGDALIYQKLVNDDFLRTDAEHSGIRIRLRGHKPGLFAMPNNPRKDEFRDHLTSVASRKWASADAIANEVDAILEGSHDLR